MRWFGHRWALAGLLALAGMGAAAATPEAAAQTVVVTDVTGREVRVALPVRRVILEESRQLYTMAMLEPGDPLARVVGWGGDLKEADPDTYREYRARFPVIDRIPVLGRFSSGAFNVERAAALRPDVIFLNVETDRAAQDSRTIETLRKFGIAVLYVDFRHHPQRNTEPSLRLFGQVLQQPARAQAFIDFRRTEIERVTQALVRQPQPAPKVFVHRIAGLSEDCCFSFGNDNLGRYVEMAGGRNLAAGLIKGTFGQVNPEQVMAANPDHVVLSSGDWSAYNPDGGWVPVGPGADPRRVQAALAAYPGKPAYVGTRAATTREFHAVWHQFYNSPYDFIVIQQLARWFHPALFSDLDPEATFRRLHERFLPVPYKSGYFASLTAPQPAGAGR